MLAPSALKAVNCLGGGSRGAASGGAAEFGEHQPLRFDYNGGTLVPPVGAQMSNGPVFDHHRL